MTVGDFKIKSLLSAYCRKTGQEQPQFCLIGTSSSDVENLVIGKASYDVERHTWNIWVKEVN